MLTVILMKIYISICWSVLLKAYLNSEYNCFAALNKNKSGENFLLFARLRQQRVFLKSEGILMHCTLTIEYLTVSTIPRQGADSFGVWQLSSVKIAFGNRSAMICYGDNETSVTRGPDMKKTGR